MQYFFFQSFVDFRFPHKTTMGRVTFLDLEPELTIFYTECIAIKKSLSLNV